MKTLRLLIALAIAGPVVALHTGCPSVPSERTTTYATLRAVHDSADAAVALSAKLYRDGSISPAQARAVMDFYDNTFQPTFRIAAISAQGNLDAVAGADVTTLAAQLVKLVQKLQNHTP